MSLILFHSPTSPYVRKVMVAAHEAGLADRLTLRTTTPWQPDGAFEAANPIGKVPALLRDDGPALTDSRVITEYFDAVGVAGFFPMAGEARWRNLRFLSLGDGILDASVGTVVERRRDKTLQSDEFFARQRSKADRILTALEAEADGLGTAITAGTIAVGVALAYTEFRKVAPDWRQGRPRLAAWFAGFEARPSMRATVPRE